MKRFKTLLPLISVLLLACITPENAFFRTRRDRCEQTGPLSWTADAGAYVYAAPYGLRKKPYGEGDPLTVEWLYTEADGSVWGYSEKLNGWVSMYGTAPKTSDGTGGLSCGTAPQKACFIADTALRAIGAAGMVSGTAYLLFTITMRRKRGDRNNGNEMVGARGLHDRRGHRRGLRRAERGGYYRPVHRGES